MVDVSPKENSKRTAIASCKVILGKKVFDMVSSNQMAKGDVLTVAKIAGISGAKHTSSLIPLCHNITLSHVCVDLIMNPSECSVEIEGEAVSTGKTGVEIEAMTAVSIAGPTVYDMCKAASKEIQITDIRLEYKTGGKSGEWKRNVTIPMNTPIKHEMEPKEHTTMQKFILLTLRHVEGTSITVEMVIKRVVSCFNCQSVVVATERNAESEFTFHVGILTMDTAVPATEKKLKSKFLEFDESQIFIGFHEGWAKVCNYLVKRDKSPSVWGEYSSEQILKLAQATITHEKSQVVPGAAVAEAGYAGNGVDQVVQGGLKV